MKKLLLILLCLPMIGLGQSSNWVGSDTANEAYESAVESLKKKSNYGPLGHMPINFPDHSIYTNSQLEVLGKNSQTIIQGFINSHCIDPCDVTWQGNELKGVCYYKHNMEIVNGCLEVKNKASGANPWDPSKIYTYAKLTIKNGRLNKVMLWYPNGQLQLKTKGSAAIFNKNENFNENSADCYTKDGYSIDCSIFDLLILGVYLKPNPYEPCK
jgi:hypothetical protein